MIYCTYCHREVSTPHHCDETVHRTAHTVYVSSHRRSNTTNATAMDFDNGRTTMRNQKEED